MIQYMSVDMVAKTLCIGRESARKLMHSMPHIVVGGKAHETIRVTVSDFEREMENRKKYPDERHVDEIKRQRQRRNDLVSRGLLNPDGTLVRRRA